MNSIYTLVTRVAFCALSLILLADYQVAKAQVTLPLDRTPTKVPLAFISNTMIVANSRTTQS